MTSRAATADANAPTATVGDEARAALDDEAPAALDDEARAALDDEARFADAPAIGAPWDTLLADAPLAFLDLEMTGLDPQRHHICELAARRVRGGIVEAELVSLVRPGSQVAASREIHGIDDAMLADAPTLASLAQPLAALLDGAVLVGHGLTMDLAFLRAASERGELLAPPAHFLDTLVLARRALFVTSYKLGALASVLSLPAPNHRALADVVTTSALFDQLCAALRAATPRILWQVRAGDERATMRDDVRATLHEAMATTGRVRLCYRVPRRSAFEDLMELRTLEPAHVTGRLARGGNLRRLRGDRILWAEVVSA